MSDQPAPKASEPTQDSPASASHVDGPTARRWNAFVSWVVGQAPGFSSLLSRFSFTGLAAAVLIFVLATYSGLVGVIESRVRDIDYFFDPAAEGLIIVDAPQLFTRERLLNERLRESEWIDEQIELVGRKLEDDRFGKPDAVALTELLLNLKKLAAVDDQGNSGTPSVQDDTKSGLQPNGAASRQAYDLLKEAEGFSPSPQTAFDAAWDFRERLSLQRYETILDDAHDLGENTLHRLNFHLTIAPARPSTDSLVAVSVRMSETFDNSQVMESYARLTIEVRKRMQDLVEQLFMDRSLIFDYGSYYRLDPTEETVIDSIIGERLNNLPREVSDGIISAEVSIYDEKRHRKIEEDILDIIRSKDSSGFWSPIFLNNNRILLSSAAQKFENDCRRPYTIVELLSSEEGNTALEDINRRISELRKRITETREASIEPKSASPSAEQGITAASYHPQSPSQQLENELGAFEAMYRGEPISVQCWDRRNAAQVSKLRLLGILYHLKLLDPKTQPVCSKSPEAMRQIVRIVLADEPIVGFSTPQGIADCDPLIRTARLLRIRLGATGAEIGLTGLADVLRGFLEGRLMETTRRQGELGDYFKFSIEGCTVEHCQVRVHTHGERLPHSNETSEVRQRKASEVGQREALRLFLELSCFANARSYTVWPRAGERDSIVDAAHEAASGRFAGTLGAEVEAGASLQTARRRDLNHIFGIGDWGVRKDDEKPACSSELMTLLAYYPVEEDFITWIRPRLNDDPEVKKWWGSVLEQCRKLKNDNPAMRCDDGLDLQTLAAIAVSVRTITTSVGWIVSPRADRPGGPSYHKALSLPLSAIVSLPSWWGRLNVEITTCWVRPRKLLGHVAPGSLCEDAKASQSNKIEIPLPGKAQEVLQKLGFFIIRTPYIDIGQRDNREPIEAGRMARIRLVGGRLWKNPRVRLGSQWHDRIEVLPNMQGLIASFDCVQPSSDYQKQIARFDAGRLMSFDEPNPNSTRGREPVQTPTDTLSELRSVQVWTSEGVTLPQPVQVFAFRPRHLYKGEPERPCWPIEPRVDADEATASTGSAAQ